MIRRDYLINGANSPHADAKAETEKVKQELIEIMDKAFSYGAIVELKIIEGVELNNSKRFSKLRLDIVSNTEFDKFHS